MNGSKDAEAIMVQMGAARVPYKIGRCVEAGGGLVCKRSSDDALKKGIVVIIFELSWKFLVFCVDSAW